MGWNTGLYRAAQLYQVQAWRHFPNELLQQAATVAEMIDTFNILQACSKAAAASKRHLFNLSLDDDDDDDDAILLIITPAI